MKKILGLTEKTGDLVIAGILFCIGLFTIIYSAMMPSSQWEVGPGFFPLIAGIFLCGVSLALGINNTFIKSRVTNRVEMGNRQVWYIIVSVIIVGILFKKIGFIPLIALFIAFILKIFSNMGHRKCFILGVAGAISAFLIFDLLFVIRLPRGELVMKLIRWSGLY